MKDQNEQRKLSEINRPMNEELFNNLEKQYQELAKVKAESEQIEKQAIYEMAKFIKESCVKTPCFQDEKPYTDCDVCAAIYLYNAGYRKQEWISVEERLPKDSERVLVYGEKGICFATRYKRDWMTPIRYNGEITHWMPLPEPPKMKGGAE